MSSHVASLAGTITRPAATSVLGLTTTSTLVEHSIEPTREPGAARHCADGEQRPRDVGRRRLAGVVADREPLAVGCEDHLGRDDEARKANRVHLRSGDGRATRPRRPDDVLDGDWDVR